VSRRPRAAIQAALEALEAGDLAEATRILLDELQEPPGRRRRHHCLYCGTGFEWPGLRDAHTEHCWRRPLRTRTA
jgi:hypothetical protein